MSRTADVGSWVRIGDRTEHLVVEVVRERRLVAYRVTACGKQLHGEWDAIMIGPTRSACPACQAHAEIAS